MPKQTTSKKVVSSNGKRSISTPVGVLIVLGVGLLLAAVGTFGYTQYKERDLKAKAARWKEIKPLKQTKGADDGVKFVGCREYTDKGPDSATGKRIKATILAAKPSSLGRAARSSANNAQLSVTTYEKVRESRTGWTDVYEWRSLGSIKSTAWWGNEVTVLVADALAPHKVVPSVTSEKGDIGTAASNEVFSRGYTTKYVAPPKTEEYDNKKDYKKALKQWQKKSISITKLPNCS